MVRLVERTPCAGVLPVTVGEVTLTEVTPGPLWSVAPFKGQTQAVSQALSAIGLAYPKPNRTVEKAGQRALWAGHGMALVMAASLPDLGDLAAVTDQSDAWAVVQVSGADAEAVLARLVPVDLRLASFKKGHTARTMVGHMMAGVSRTGPKTFDVMVMRSMAATLVHDLSRAATLYAGRP